MIRLWIKGSVTEAKEAAAVRGIELHNAEQTQRGTVLADVLDEHLVRVVHWYCEDTKSEPGKGFPAGTLLIHC